MSSSRFGVHSSFLRALSGCTCASRSHTAPALSLVLADTFHVWAQNRSEQPRNRSTEFSVSHIPQTHRCLEVLPASLLLPCQLHVTQLPMTPATPKLSHLTCVSLARVLAKSTAWEKASVFVGNSCRKKRNSSTRPFIIKQMLRKHDVSQPATK